MHVTVGVTNIADFTSVRGEIRHCHWGCMPQEDLTLEKHEKARWRPDAAAAAAATAAAYLKGQSDSSDFWQHQKGRCMPQAQCNLGDEVAEGGEGHQDGRL